ncbi:MBL fold metallo-hydrolase [Methanohalophilus portucalensis]|uniref:Glyoxylase, beta-lactamase superfamily II n=1 Tax=Methanohalophilus portucalensis FDF-1 TaxID=523843 RepID=A0A1L9C6G8_9EURY|nr:MBL fold metallo-hydrolase [Methanohalophilus portucalensis]OJH50115.1 hypothetical protein MPF_0910 [Methanohalophilus portucalensis FDF-1]RNI13101.1 MBL fold metallo-hydrolase [Methanohalophilus portucalensis FDF-1]SMH31356.1 Glyoxylase, beta-lactamase superfamily II [Methanohalophilus portucalensis FDF-1]
MSQPHSYNITPIQAGASNAYLVTENSVTILVDSGNRGNTHKFETVLKNKGLNFADIDYIILTHSHHDHVGCLEEIKKRSKAKVIAHREEVEYLKRGYTPFPEGTMLFSRLISGFANKFLPNMGKYTPVDPDIIIDGECEILLSDTTIQILPVTGHTSGSICVIIDNESAIVGDTLFSFMPESVYPPFANDEKALIKSWKKLLSTGCNIFYPGHGKPFSRARFEKCYSKKKDYT